MEMVRLTSLFNYGNVTMIDSILKVQNSNITRVAPY